MNESVYVSARLNLSPHTSREHLQEKYFRNILSAVMPQKRHQQVWLLVQEKKCIVYGTIG